MTKYRKARQVAANFLVGVIHLGNQMHIRIHRLLDILEEENLTVWKKVGLWIIKVYALVLPRNGNGTDDDV